MSSLPHDSPGRDQHTSTQATAAASLPPGSPGLQQASAPAVQSATSSSSPVAPSTAPSTTSISAASVKQLIDAPTWAGIFAFAWVLFGFIGFVFSLVCFGYSGSIVEKIFGFFLALIFGPFYFVYYFSDGAYCRRMAPTLF